MVVVAARLSQLATLRGAGPSGALKVDAQREGARARDVVAARLPVATACDASRTELQSRARSVRRRAPATLGAEGRARCGLRLRATWLPDGAARAAAPARARAQRIAALGARRDTRIVDAAASRVASEPEAASLPRTAAVSSVESGQPCVDGHGRGACIGRRRRMAAVGAGGAFAGQAADAAAAARENEEGEEERRRPHGRALCRSRARHGSGIPRCSRRRIVPGRAYQGMFVIRALYAPRRCSR